jgi:hypothetical protein
MSLYASWENPARDGTLFFDQPEPGFKLAVLPRIFSPVRAIEKSHVTGIFDACAGNEGPRIGYLQEVSAAFLFILFLFVM